MARIEWVRHRLENWARWCQQGDGRGLGYPSQSAFVRMGVPSARDRDSAIPVLAIEAAETDEAVKSLQLSQSHLFLVLTYTYAKGWPRDVVAKKMCRAESTISANLEAADRAIKRWLDEKQAVKLKKQADAKALAAAQALKK
jgi:hypothetical protein